MIKRIAGLALGLSLAVSAAQAQSNGLAGSAQGAHDWTGFYVGALGARFDGDNRYSGPNSAAGYRLDARAGIEGSAGGLFGGYLWDRGTYAWGVELAFTGNGVHEVGYPNWTYSSIIDVKARVGRKFGSSLAYVSAGYSTAKFKSDFMNLDTRMSGYNLGFGVDHAAGRNLVIGAEYVHRKINDGSFPLGGPGSSYKGTPSSAQIRLAWKF